MGKDQLLVKKYEQRGVQHQVGGPAGAQHTLASRILLLPDIPSQHPERLEARGDGFTAPVLVLGTCALRS
jgi:hypothetical protein